MNWIRAICCVLLLASGVQGQSNFYGTGQAAYARLTPVYQSWTIDGDSSIVSTSVPLQLYLPLAQQFGMSILTGFADFSSDAGTGLNGLTDTQVAFTYLFEEAGLVANLGFNLPSGKYELSFDEFASSALLSNLVLDFRLPGFGSGFSVSPGVTWARELHEDVVAGAGLAYVHRTGYTPIEALPLKYAPGAELVATAGLDVRLAAATTLSGNVIFTHYQADKLGEQEIFQAGSKLVANAQFRTYFAFDELWLFLRFRQRGKNELVPVEKTLPNQVDARLVYRRVFNPKVAVRLRASGHFFDETSDPFSDARLLRLGFAPELTPDPRVSLMLDFGYATGRIKNDRELRGFEAGMNLSVQLFSR